MKGVHYQLRVEQATKLTDGACSDVIKPRRPFAKDPALDYEVMEDEEWEPEPEGDSLSVRL